jgi:MFS family permease
MERSEWLSGNTKLIVNMGADQKTSVWTPLKNPLFRDLWVGAIFSSIATWIHNVAAAWLMLMLTTSPLMVGLLNAAASFPYLILSLPAGALADMADRRRLLLFTHGWMLAVAALLGSLTILVGMTAWGLLTFTLLLGLGSALNLPTWEASILKFCHFQKFPSRLHWIMSPSTRLWPWDQP